MTERNCRGKVRDTSVSLWRTCSGDQHRSKRKIGWGRAGEPWCRLNLKRVCTRVWCQRFACWSPRFRGGSCYFNLFFGLHMTPGQGSGVSNSWCRVVGWGREKEAFTEAYHLEVYPGYSIHSLTLHNNSRTCLSHPHLMNKIQNIWVVWGLIQFVHCTYIYLRDVVDY